MRKNSKIGMFVAFTLMGLMDMKVGFSYWKDRIAPVFDTATQLWVVEMEGGEILAQTEATVPEGAFLPKVLRLKELGVQTLVCGAVSRPFHQLLIAYGIQVVPFVAGELKEVLEAYQDGTLWKGGFCMPGCGGWRGGRRGGRGYGWNRTMPGYGHKT